MVDTYILFIDKTLENELFTYLMGYVSDEKKRKIQGYYRIEDAQRSLWGDILARYAISKSAAIENKQIVFGDNGYGKPVLLGSSAIHFNISHSGSRVACAIDNRPVGIDVESIKPVDLKIAERFFSKDEYRELLEKDEEMRLTYFYMLWTLKESYIKADGKGLAIPLDSFTVSIRNDRVFIQTSDGSPNYFFKQHKLEDTHMLSVCARHNEFGDIIYLDTHQLFQEIQLYL